MKGQIMIQKTCKRLATISLAAVFTVLSGQADRGGMKKENHGDTETRRKENMLSPLQKSFFK